MSSAVKRVLAVGFVGAVFGMSGSVIAQADESFETKTTQADVDGDGRLDGVTLREVSADSQTLTFGLADEQVQITIAGDARYPLQTPRPVDVNSDGSHEVTVPEFIGANTITSNIWRYDVQRGKIFPVSNPDGSRLKVYEGGGASARSGYNCFDYPDTGARDLETLEARMVGTSDGSPLFNGVRTRYHVVYGIATQVKRVEYEAIAGTDPRLDSDPRSCGAVV